MGKLVQMASDISNDYHSGEGEGKGKGKGKGMGEDNKDP